MHRRSSNSHTVVVESDIQTMDALHNARTAILLRVERMDQGLYEAVFCAMDGRLPNDLPSLIDAVDIDPRKLQNTHAEKPGRIIRVRCREWKHWKYDAGADTCMVFEGFEHVGGDVFVVQLGHEANRVVDGDFITQQGILIARNKAGNDVAASGKVLKNVKVFGYHASSGIVQVAYGNSATVHDLKVRFEPPAHFFDAGGRILPLKIRMKKDVGAFGYCLVVEEK